CGWLYLSCGRIEFNRGAFLRSPVDFAYSDDAGKSWSRPIDISGSNPTFCTANQGPAGPAGACDESFFSYGAVEPNGDLVVGFMNQQHSAAWEVPNEFEDQIMTVTSHDGGATWSNPVHVADMEDGGLESIKFTDYPANVAGRATQTGFQFRTGSWGNLNVDPVTGTLYAVWTDNSDGAHDVANPVTDTNVFMSVSGDEGATWSAPIRVTSGVSDKWFPWVAARAGKVGVVYQEEATDGSGTYVTRMATSTNDGTSWSYQTVSTAVSDADHSVWFQAPLELGAGGLEMPLQALFEPRPGLARAGLAAERRQLLPEVGADVRVAERGPAGAGRVPAAAAPFDRERLVREVGAEPVQPDA